MPADSDSSDIFYGALRPFLFSLPPETAHRLGLAWLRASAACRPPPSPPEVLPRKAMGLSFANPLGLAAGFDKNGGDTDGLARLGFGFAEAGAITPLPQAGNAQPRLFRLPMSRALVNRMGFNNCGMREARRLLLSRRGDYVLGINLGKNAQTPANAAAEDYRQCLETLYDCGDFFTLNISSPNTPGLRDLQTPATLRALLESVLACRDRLADSTGKRKPVAIKLSPDLSAEQLSAVAETAAAASVDGVIAFNTVPLPTSAVENHKEEWWMKKLAPGEECPSGGGGLSGAPLTERALAMTCELRKTLPSDIALIASGGVMTAEDAAARLDAGADLVQIYTALIYAGPALPRQILAALKNMPPVMEAADASSDEFGGGTG